MLLALRGGARDAIQLTVVPRMASHRELLDSRVSSAEGEMVV